eukprot:Unigene6289_Nuclearia_a/m.19375 Unigene6289_Nuclearia_a/g.19375  ORF Unigene6289_Nuclearia_a/g.19375 Unigene6289_Nuclearia_a/m.19375 type:complete len:314 (+) Unigene6289_Nuclearia_a:404-1345(+)
MQRASTASSGRRWSSHATSAWSPAFAAMCTAVKPRSLTASITSCLRSCSRRTISWARTAHARSTAVLPSRSRRLSTLSSSPFLTVRRNAVTRSTSPSSHMSSRFELSARRRASSSSFMRCVSSSGSSLTTSIVTWVFSSNSLSDWAMRSSRCCCSRAGERRRRRSVASARSCLTRPVCASISSLRLSLVSGTLTPSRTIASRWSSRSLYPRMNSPIMSSMPWLKRSSRCCASSIAAVPPSRSISRTSSSISCRRSSSCASFCSRGCSCRWKSCSALRRSADVMCTSSFSRSCDIVASSSRRESAASSPRRRSK